MDDYVELLSGDAQQCWVAMLGKVLDSRQEGAGGNTLEAWSGIANFQDEVLWHIEHISAEVVHLCAFSTCKLAIFQTR